MQANYQKVQELLAAGANPNVKDNAGWTPLVSSQASLISKSLNDIYIFFFNTIILFSLKRSMASPQKLVLAVAYTS